MTLGAGSNHLKQALDHPCAYLTVSEAQRLVKACEPGFRELVQAALATGARYGELIALRVADFDQDAGTLTVRMAKNGRGRHIILADEGVKLFKSLAAGLGRQHTIAAEGRRRAVEADATDILDGASMHRLLH